MGELGHDGLAVPGRVVLARELPFRLGKLQVLPAVRQLIAGDRRETLEPRVMQVLVLLARANGDIVTRDELIHACWDGRIVSENAINRVISRVRQLAQLCPGAFEVETITKVGYRLAVTGLPVPDAVAGPRAATGKKLSRRAVIGGAVAIVGAAGTLWQRPWRHRPPAEAEDLYRRGALAWKAGLGDQARQSVSFFERAVQIDPLYGEAWGALAVAYTHLLEGYGEAEMASVPGRIRSAAGRALELGADNGDAQLALICIRPFFRNWASMEKEMRSLCERFPRNWLAHARLAVLLYQVGRLNDGIEFHRRVLEIDQMIPLTHMFLIRALSNLGRFQEAEAAISEARLRWPAHPAIWNAAYAHLLFSGRPKAAAVLIMDPDARPSGVGQDEIEQRLRLARAIDTRHPADVEASVEDLRQLALSDVAGVPAVAPILALLDRADLAFASLDRYYFNRGNFGAPSPAIGPYTRRYTDTLFSLPMAAGRADSRFASLVRELGLEGYWQAVRTPPDYRRLV